MTQADRVLSTPPTNTPIDTTRRRFLTVAAGASAASVGSLTAAAVPAPPVGASPALRAAIRVLDQAHADLTKAKAINDAAWALTEKWERDNPKPISKKGIRRWLKASRTYHLKVTPAPWNALMRAELAFAQAQIDVALVPIAGPADVHTMAACAVIYDRVELNFHNRAPIAIMVADEVMRLGLAVLS